VHEILDPNHWRWREFIMRLSHEIGDGCSGCLLESISIMEEFGDIDIVGTLEQFGLHGIDRDCEVLTFASNPPDDPPKPPRHLTLVVDNDNSDRTGVPGRTAQRPRR
jgi:hypothetical protein